MNKLVIRQTYINGTAFDTSNNLNHGLPYAVTQAASAQAPAFEFPARTAASSSARARACKT